MTPSTVPGPQGEQGEQGEQGPPGLAGQVGKLGLKGNQGNRGNPGTTGKAGEPGRHGSNRWLQMLSLYAFVAVIFILLAWRVEVNTSDIRNNQIRNDLERCESGVAVVKQFNTFQHALADIEREGLERPDIDEATKVLHRERIKVYEGFILETPDCSELPQPSG